MSAYVRNGTVPPRALPLRPSVVAAPSPQMSMVDYIARSWRALIASSCIVLLITGVAAAEESSSATSPRAQLHALSQVFSEVAAEATPAVVFIKAERRVQSPQMRRSQPGGPFNDPFHDEFFRRFFGDRLPERQRQQPQREAEPRYRAGQGSGFIVSADGDILTNHHVVAGADRLTVTLHDGRELPAQLVGSDEQSDLAVLRIEAAHLPTLTKGSSHGVRVGEWVIAIGNPFGLSHTVTAGIVSAKGRSRVGIADYEDFIQTDAAINPGNSGGPLLNLDGEVVGINTAIFSRSGGYMGIGFAIPIDMARTIYRQLRDDGSVTRGYLGVAIQDLSSELAESFGLEQRYGVVITQVEEGSAAAEAGLRAQDVVLRMDGSGELSSTRFRNAVALKSPGDAITLEVWRDGETMEMLVTVGQRVAQASEPLGESLQTWGLSVEPLSDALRQEFSLASDQAGVVITAVADGSPAASRGIRPGQVIVGINHREVSNMDEFQEAITELRGSQRPVRLVLRQGGWNILAVLPAL